MTSLYIGIAGALGALTRYTFSLLWNSASADVFPWGTLFCNLAGTLLLSFSAYSMSIRLTDGQRLALTTGFIGAFTTFSALSFETFELLRSGHLLLAVIYMMANLWGGLLFAWLGSRAAKLWPPRGIHS